METCNWPAVLVGGIVPMIVGFIWYHKALFGSAWMKSLGFTEEDLKGGNMAMIFGVSFLVALLIAYFIQMYIGFHAPEEQTFTHSAFHGMMFAVMIAVPVLISNSLFEKKNWTNILINAAYWTVTFALMGGVMSFFF